MMGDRWRFYFVIFLIASSLWVISPLLININKAPYWVSKIMPSQSLKLGLDLQGGTHLVLGVDIDKVVIEHADRNVERLIKTFQDKKVDIEKVYRRDKTSQVTVKAKNSTDIKTIGEIVTKYTGMVYMTSADNEITFDVKDQDKEYIKKKAIDQTIEAIRNRIDEFGVNEPSIQAQGNDRIVVQLPGVKDAARAKSIIGRTARLEFKLVQNKPDFNHEKLILLINKAAEAGIVYEEGKTTYTDYADNLNEYLAKNKSIPEDSIVLFERKVDPQSGKKMLIPYLLDKASPVTGDHLKDAYIGFNSEFGEPYVSFQMNTLGSRFMEELTGKNIGRQLAIVLDKNVYSAPTIQAKISDSGQITLGGGRPLTEIQQEAEDIALVLRAGALPAQLNFEEERVVGPSLGSDSIAEGKLSFILGSILVILFMGIYYRFSGFIANLAVIMNVILVVAVLMLFGSTLTMPGIAGIILTVGMSVDANVIINERIREEYRSGNAAKAALENGYHMAFWTVIDAHITNMIAGIVLLQYGTGPIKGFAVTLLIGIVSSIFTAVYLTKWVFEYLMDKGKLKKLSI
ncbi:MAG: protein translocase subunit SecD [Proteobacteria bacterium]|nr:protein translocase subunit SecD [Pseudomonadota bacterium]